MLALLLIGGCQRSKPDALPTDAQAEAQARTSAKAEADIVAAEDAARTPLAGSPRGGGAQALPARKPATADAPEPDMDGISENDTAAQ